MQIDITEIIGAVISLLLIILTRFVIPLLKNRAEVLKSKADDAKAQLAQTGYFMLQRAAETVVMAAEQLYNSDEGEKKKSYAISQLELQGFTADQAAVDAAIEAAVKKLKMELYNK